MEIRSLHRYLFIFLGIRRRLERSHEDCRARNGEFPSGTEDGAHVARRSLFTHIDRRRLPRLPGSGYPQGRALHDSQVDFHKEATISYLIVSAEISFGPSLGVVN